MCYSTCASGPTTLSMCSRLCLVANCPHSTQPRVSALVLYCTMPFIATCEDAIGTVFWDRPGVSVQGVSVQGGLCPGGLCLGGLCPGGLCLGGLCPEGLCLGDGLCLGSLSGGLSLGGSLSLGGLPVNR